MKDNIILVDCDGVLCDWEYSFTQWMHHKGIPTVDESQYNVAKRLKLNRDHNYVKEFNDSAAIAFLPPLRDAVYYMKRLNMLHGFRFHCITSLSTNKYAQRLRTQNLELLFGKEIFDEYVYLPCGADKDEALAEYKDTGCFWVEDKPENAKVGAALGLNSILVAHDHNADEVNGTIPRFWKWKQIYKHIIGEE
jgi:beta-phosphoglucomutase-like phosphatase (HAD superfamily)